MHIATILKHANRYCYELRRIQAVAAAGKVAATRKGGNTRKRGLTDAMVIFARDHYTSIPLKLMAGWFGCSIVTVSKAARGKMYKYLNPHTKVWR